jgi:hypothetical protein
MLDHTTLTSILRYDPNSGDLYWNKRRPKVKVGAKAGCLHHKGYINLEIDGKFYAAHRLVWFYVTGFMPTKIIDHINGNKSDNRFENLREATTGQNRANSKHNNRHGLKGVNLCNWVPEGKRRWVAQIRSDKKQIYLGSFFTKEEAHSAYCEAAKRLHGEFAKP